VTTHPESNTGPAIPPFIHPGEILGRAAFLDSTINTMIGSTLAHDRFSWELIVDDLLPRLSVSDRIRLIQKILDNHGLAVEYAGLCDELRQLFGLRNVAAHYIGMYSSPRRFDGLYERRGKFQRVTFTFDDIVGYLERITAAYGRLDQLRERLPKSQIEHPVDPEFHAILDGIMSDSTLDVQEGRVEVDLAAESIAAKIIEELATKAALDERDDPV
jgi:hypothetical protein